MKKLYYILRVENVYSEEHGTNVTITIYEDSRDTKEEAIEIIKKLHRDSSRKTAYTMVPVYEYTYA